MLVAESQSHHEMSCNGQIDLKRMQAFRSASSFVRFMLKCLGWICTQNSVVYRDKPAEFWVGCRSEVSRQDNRFVNKYKSLIYWSNIHNGDFSQKIQRFKARSSFSFQLEFVIIGIQDQGSWSSDFTWKLLAKSSAIYGHDCIPLAPFRSG
jgi:hypothetical protein